MGKPTQRLVIRVVACLLFHTMYGHVTSSQYLFTLRKRCYNLFCLLVLLKQFQCQPSGTIAQTKQVIAFQERLYIGNTILYLMSMIDMDMTIVVVVSLLTLKDMNHLTQQFRQSPNPLPVLNDVGTIGIPNNELSVSMDKWSPRRSVSSNIFSAHTTLRCISIS